ncbi:ferredoxin [Mycolicibacterium neoaurum]|nr:ferredoxin [Mycolicibacterium neoaurum]AXK75613.1 oxidoreductase [Mycolicibacterium neoaurum]KUM09618.1 ferredoxin [Mycolicibacterium neoaurum]
MQSEVSEGSEVVEGRVSVTDTDPARKDALELVVAHRADLADGVVGLVLEDPAGGPLPEWTAGAHIDLELTDVLVRQYSLCSSPDDRHRWRVAVLLERGGRGGSRHVHDSVVQGSRIRVGGPRNHFPLQPADRYQFIAGGIGITPIIPMIERAEADGADWHLLYGGRQRSSMAFADVLAGYGDRVTFWPQDELGMLDLNSVLRESRDDTLVYCCGPEGLLCAVEQACSHWPASALHVERFAARPDALAPAEGALDTFDVVCRTSGVTVTIGRGESILETLRENGINMLASCMEGICGTCETRVLEGTPDHRDSVLSADEQAENDYMMICVSRSLSPTLVLDV